MRDAAPAIVAAELDNHVDAIGTVAKDLLIAHVDTDRHDEQRQPVDGFERCIGMDRRKRACMACVDRIEEGFAFHAAQMPRVSHLG